MIASIGAIIDHCVLVDCATTLSTVSTALGDGVCVWGPGGDCEGGEEAGEEQDNEEEVRTLAASWAR